MKKVRSKKEARAEKKKAKNAVDKKVETLIPDDIKVCWMVGYFDDIQHSWARVHMIIRMCC